MKTRVVLTGHVRIWVLRAVVSSNNPSPRRFEACDTKPGIQSVRHPPTSMVSAFPRGLLHFCSALPRSLRSRYRGRGHRGGGRRGGGDRGCQLTSLGAGARRDGTANLPESLSQATLVGTMIVGRSGVHASRPSRARHPPLVPAPGPIAPPTLGRLSDAEQSFWRVSCARGPREHLGPAGAPTRHGANEQKVCF